MEKQPGVVGEIAPPRLTELTEQRDNGVGPAAVDLPQPARQTVGDIIVAAGDQRKLPRDGDPAEAVIFNMVVEVRRGDRQRFGGTGERKVRACSLRRLAARGVKRG